MFYKGVVGFGPIGAPTDGRVSSTPFANDVHNLFLLHACGRHRREKGETLTQAANLDTASKKLNEKKMFFHGSSFGKAAAVKLSQVNKLLKRVVRTGPWAD